MASAKVEISVSAAHRVFCVSIQLGYSETWRPLEGSQTSLRLLPAGHAVSFQAGNSALQSDHAGELLTPIPQSASLRLQKLAGILPRSPEPWRTGLATSSLCLSQVCSMLCSPVTLLVEVLISHSPSKIRSRHHSLISRNVSKLLETFYNNVLNTSIQGKGRGYWWYCSWSSLLE